jgi:hypothetical protein
VWLAGAAIGFLVMLSGAARLAWIAIRSEPVQDRRWAVLAEEVRRSLGIRRPVRLLQNQSVPFLGTWGIVVPRVLVPSNAESWSDQRVRMVLGHELAHIKRHDWMVQVLAEAARAIYWFNPMFWLVCSRLRRESEHACDDAVVRMGAAGTHYAEELLDLTRTLRSGHHLQSPILAMAQPSHLERRLVALLNPSLNRLAATPWAVIVVALAAVALTLPLAAIRATEEAVTPAVPTATVAASPQPPVRTQPDVLGTAPGSPSTKTSTTLATAPASPASPLPLETQVENPAQIAFVKPEVPAFVPSNAPQPPTPAVSEPPPYICNVTQSVRETRRENEKSVSFGAGPWHISEDRVLWVWDQPYVAGREVNTIWMRPVNAEITITGKRLDGEAPALETRARSDYRSGYLATGLVFPAAGCWEITATTGESRLTFVTRVENL